MHCQVLYRQIRSGFCFSEFTIWGPSFANTYAHELCQQVQWHYSCMWSYSPVVSYLCTVSAALAFQLIVWWVSNCSGRWLQVFNKLCKSEVKEKKYRSHFSKRELKTQVSLGSFSGSKQCMLELALSCHTGLNYVYLRTNHSEEKITR